MSITRTSGGGGTNNYNTLINKPNIPVALSELSEDSTHRLVTDEEKGSWNSILGISLSESIAMAIALGGG